MDAQSQNPQFNTNWSLLVIPNADGTLASRHPGLSLEGAVLVLQAILSDYQAELEQKAEQEGGGDG